MSKIFEGEGGKRKDKREILGKKDVAGRAEHIDLQQNAANRADNSQQGNSHRLSQQNTANRSDNPAAG
tara:strand:+ start:221 stop:424 length:204 start_codon:yes stop_codon:yes gene_type:complete